MKLDMGYTTERRAAVIAKMPPPDGVRIAALSRREEISEATLDKWRNAARARGRLAPDAVAAPSGWTSRDKFAAVVGTVSLNAEALAAYRRERGLYPGQIVAWRAACERANDWARETAADRARLSREDRKPVRELARKEKGLAALPTPRKKRRRAGPQRAHHAKVDRPGRVGPGGRPPDGRADRPEEPVERGGARPDRGHRRRP